MAALTNPNALWDLSLPSLGDDDFIALLQRQFGGTNDNFQSVKQPGEPSSQPTSIPIAGTTPPLSEDSSPSPPSIPDTGQPRSRRQSGVTPDHQSLSMHNQSDDESPLKRKASYDDLDDEPNYKNQHLANSGKRNSATRRKSTGANANDENRLLKRKEQNRAAQRAFRERKEKHVKDLEDKVASLEEKNHLVVSENDTLREVISRLQNENLRLRESSFTFTVPGPIQRETNMAKASSSDARNSPPSFYHSGSSSSSGPSSTQASPQSLFVNDPGDGQQNKFFNPLITATSTADAMGVDFGFGPANDTPYTTIASNPLFMSFREPTPMTFHSESPATIHNIFGSNRGVNQLDFLSPNLISWPDSAMHDTPAFDLTNSLDELLGTVPMSSSGPIDFTSSFKSPSLSSLSPVSHQQSQSQPASSSRDSSSPDAPLGTEVQMHDASTCPKTKADLAKKIAQDTGSVFTSQSPLSPQKPDVPFPCQGISLPKVPQSENNLEVMSAWKSITSNPQFKDIDMNELCAEFASKARCDGSKVVIEPSSMQHIIECVSKKGNNC